MALHRWRAGRPTAHRLRSHGDGHRLSRCCGPRVQGGLAGCLSPLRDGWGGRHLKALPPPCWEPSGSVSLNARRWPPHVARASSRHGSRVRGGGEPDTARQELLPKPQSRARCSASNEVPRVSTGGLTDLTPRGRKAIQAKFQEKYVSGAKQAGVAALAKWHPPHPLTSSQTQAGAHGTRAWRRFPRPWDGSWRGLDGHVTYVPCSAHLVLPSEWQVP